MDSQGCWCRDNIILEGFFTSSDCIRGPLCSGLKKNLISVSTIEYKGYEVTFRGGQVIMYPMGSSIDSSKVIGVWHGKLYKFAFQPVGALVSSVGDNT